MCGFIGIVKYNKCNNYDSEAVAKGLKSISHRGPDYSGILEQEQFILGHARLSIIDLSSNAHQPMSHNDIHIAFNGEIYNYKSLRSNLEKAGHVFNSKSDTEVLLKLYIEHGTQGLALLDGMFSFALVDKPKGKAYLARDRFGIKPLYYKADVKAVYFGSEIKAIRCIDPSKIEVNIDALAEWSYYGNTLREKTLYKDIKKLLPGHYLEIDLNTLAIHSTPYWELKSHKFNAAKSISLECAVKETRRLLEQAVSRQLVGDVPIGVFLSGGIDSSAITAFASRNYEHKLNTFSVGFDFDKGVNELPKARKIAQTFGTNHNEITISGYDLADTLEKLVDLHDSPFSDAANIPLFLLGQKVRGEIKVVLQGDGGDEFFAGYRRYQTLRYRQIWKYFINTFAKINHLSPKNNPPAFMRERYLNALNNKDEGILMALLLTEEDKYSHPEMIFQKNILSQINRSQPFLEYQKCNQRFQDLDITQRMLFTDTQIILPDIFFEKVDRATMGASIEVRVPFLDNDLTEFALSLPSKYKVKHGISKWLLRKALEGIIPNDILYGKKVGFSVPYGYWLKGPLKEIFFDKLNKLSNTASIINKAHVKTLMDEHSSGKKNNSFILWKTLNLMIWLLSKPELISSLDRKPRTHNI